MIALTPEKDPKSELTLSAAQELLCENDRSAADRFEELLELHDRAIELGLTRLADDYADRIIDEMTAGTAR